MASFKAKFPVLQELFAKNHRGGPLGPPPPAGRGLNVENIEGNRSPPPPPGAADHARVNLT